MRPFFAGSPVATGLFVGSLVIWIMLEVRQALSRRPDATNMDRGSLLVLRACVAVGMVLGAFAMRVQAAAVGSTIELIAASLLLIWAGIGLRLWSFRTLGVFFTFSVMTSPGQSVVTTGPYRMLRHPSYTGMLLVLIGIGIAYGNWLSLAAFVVFPLIGFINRIRVEEAALSSSLGEAYTSYATHRKRMIPFVW
jgi:protein-S-isoprenylcysteine O-methyltransferase Ste14